MVIDVGGNSIKEEFSKAPSNHSAEESELTAIHMLHQESNSAAGAAAPQPPPPYPVYNQSMMTTYGGHNGGAGLAFDEDLMSGGQLKSQLTGYRWFNTPT